MGDKFDSWNGFMEAGFAQAVDGRLKLGNDDVTCIVTRIKFALLVNFVIRAIDVDIDFEMPLSFSDFWSWAEFFAKRTVGSRKRWRQWQDAVGTAMPADLVDLISIGSDNLEDEEVQVKPNAPVVKLPGGDMPQVDRLAYKATIVLRSYLSSMHKEYLWRLQEAKRTKDIDVVEALASRAGRLKELLACIDEAGTFIGSSEYVPTVKAAVPPRPKIIEKCPAVKAESTNPPSLFDNLDLFPNASEPRVSSKKAGIQPLSNGQYLARDVAPYVKKIARAHSYTLRALISGTKSPRKLGTSLSRGRGTITIEDLRVLAHHMGVSVSDFGVSE